jgi:hypothetical protein
MFIRAVQHNTALDAFRAEVREFCEREMPPEVRRKQARGQHADLLQGPLAIAAAPASMSF